MKPRGDGHGASSQKLRHVRHRFIQKNTLRAAIVRVATTPIWMSRKATRTATDRAKSASFFCYLMGQYLDDSARAVGKVVAQQDAADLRALSPLIYSCEPQWPI
jgi:hypothetical protein